MPVLCGSAFKNKGVQPLLDAVVDYLPCPLDIPPTKGTTTQGRRASSSASRRRRAVLGARLQDHDRPVAASSPTSASTRARSRRASALLNSTKDKQGAHRPHPPDARQPPRGQGGRLAGDIVAAVGLKTTTTGDTLCDPDNPIVLEALEFPEPVIHVAVEPKTKADQDKLGMALFALSEEDPTFRVHTDEETGQTVISGMGELHLEVLVDRMLREFKVDANVGKPQVAYRETIRDTVRRSRSATSARPAAAASTATSSSTSSRPGPAAATSSSTRSPAA